MDGSNRAQVGCPRFGGDLYKEVSYVQKGRNLSTGREDRLQGLGQQAVLEDREDPGRVRAESTSCQAEVTRMRDGRAGFPVLPSVCKASSEQFLQLSTRA